MGEGCRIGGVGGGSMGAWELRFLFLLRSVAPLPRRPNHSDHLLSHLLIKLEVSGEEEEGKGEADGDKAGEDEVEPDVANADALAFYDHEH